MITLQHSKSKDITRQSFLMNQYYFCRAHINCIFIYCRPKRYNLFSGIYVRIRKSVGPPALLLTIITFNKRTFIVFQLIFQKIKQQLNLSLLTQLKSRISKSSKPSCRAVWQLPLHVLLHTLSTSVWLIQSQPLIRAELTEMLCWL